jgi:hypothetical protein
MNRTAPARGRQEPGQALVVIVAIVALLVLIPASVQMMAVHQLPTSQQTTFAQQALEAARGGLSDYVNWAQTHAGYPSSYCSSGVPAWTCAGTFTDGSSTSGSTTFTSATANFTSADVGRSIVENDAKGAIPAGTSIAAVVSSTTITLSQNAAKTASGVSFRIPGRGAFTDGSATAGSSTFTSATANFASSDVGKAIVETDGQGAIPAGTTIQSVTSSTTVVLSQNAAASASEVAFQLPARVATADTNNPAFANSALAGQWVYTQGSASSNPSVAYQYLVNDTTLSGLGLGLFTVYATGRAGDPGHWVYQTVEATMEFGAPACPGAPVTIPIPAWATWLSVTAVGAQGGGENGGQGDGGDGGELGSIISDTWPLTSPYTNHPWPVGSSITLMPGSAGYSGSYHLLSLAAMGGSGGCGAPGLAGGNGGGQGLGVSTQLGGGGGAASAVCFGVAADCTNASEIDPGGEVKMCNPSFTSPCLLIVAGGGGGAGGQNSLGAAGGSGGWYCSANCATSPTWTPNGGNGTAILGLGQASGGSQGGSSSTTGASGGIARGWDLIGALNGTGGGGGGGAGKGGGGGQAGVLGIGVGASGGGGGNGDSTVSATPISCNSSPTVTQAPSSAYGSSGDGVVSVQFLTGSGCSSLSLVSTYLALLEAQQIDPTPSLQ